MIKAMKLKQNDYIRIGKEAVTEFRREFPDLHSDSKIFYIARNLNWFNNVSKNTRNTVIKTRHDTFVLLDAMRKEIDCTNPDKAIPQLKETIKKYKIANCGEQTRIMTDILQKKGINAQSFGFDHLNDGINIIDHCFTIIGHRGGNYLDDTAGYLDGAVAVDTFQHKGLVMPLKKALEWCENFFKIKFELGKFVMGPLEMWET